MDRHIDVQGYDGRPGTSVTQAIRLILRLEVRAFLQAPFLLIDMKRDIILGNGWLRSHDITPRSYNHTLIWPANLPAIPKFSGGINMPRNSLNNLETLSHEEYQAIIYRRDQFFDVNFVDPSNIPQAKFTNRYSWDIRNNLKKMERLIERHQNKEILLPSEGTKTDILVPSEGTKTAILNHILVNSDPYDSPLHNSIDITAITAEAFELHTRRRDNNVFSTSIHEVDKILKDRTNHMEPAEIEELRPLAPPGYHNWIDAFSKTLSNELLKHTQYDHRIEISKDAILKTSPIHNISTGELLVVKEYIIDNLKKKWFIEASSPPFAAPFLFVAKPDGGLRFCIDYRCLNTITKGMNILHH